MALSKTAKIGIAVAGGLAVLGLASGGSGGGTQSVSFEPQRVPSVPPGLPPTQDGEERNNDEGRTWGTFHIDRNARKHYELRVLSVDSSPSVAAIGTGDVIVDVYETIVANADWQWHGQVCNGTQWRLKFSAGRLMGFSIIGSKTCASVRPTTDVWSRGMTWIQIGANVLLVLDTNSGINKLSPDRMTVPPKGPGKYGGTGKFYDNVKHPQWDNDYVASGYVTLDASWVFNAA